MTSASELFSVRRSSRSTNRSSDEDHRTLGSDSFHTFPSLSQNRRHCKTTTNGRRQSRPVFDDSDLFRRSSHIPRPSSSRTSASSGGGCLSVHLDRGASESPTGSIIDRETLVSINARYHGNSRLPRAVLLAKERLLQRLRGASVSGALPGVYHNDFWLAGARDWETSLSTEHIPGSSPSTEPLPEAHQLYALQEPIKKPPGLTKDMLTCLHHELFMKVGRGDEHPNPDTANDCSICLDSFVEGNRLIRLPCRHKFHTSCLYPWVQTCGECPYCRTAIILKGQADE